MASDKEIKKLLVSLGLITKDFKTEISQLRRESAAWNQEEIKALERNLAALKKQTTQLSYLNQEKHKTVIELEKQLGLLKNQAKQQDENNRKHVTELDRIKAKIKADIEHQKLVQQARKELGLIERGPSLGMRLRESLRGAGGQVGGALAGGGAAGTLMSGLLGGGAAGLAIAGVTALGTALGNVVSRIKELIKNTGPLRQQYDLFTQYAEQNGKTAAEWVNQLKEATRGLVDDNALVANANKLMQQNAGLLPDQLTKITELTTRFARVQGKDATQGMEILTSSLIRGRYNLLAYQLGLDKATVAEVQRLEKLPASIRLNEQMNLLIKRMEEQLKRTNEPAETLSETLTRLRVSTGSAFDAFAKGLTGSKGLSGISEVLNKISKWLDKIGPDLEKFGNLVSEVFGSIIDLGAEVAKALVPISGGEASFLWKGFQTVLVGTAEAAAILTNGIGRLSARITYLKDLTTMSVGDATNKFENTLNELDVDFDDKITRLDALIHPVAQPKNTTKTTVRAKSIDPDEERRKAQAELEKRRAALELAFKKEAVAIQLEQERIDRLLNTGLMNFADYVDAKKKLAEQEFNNEKNKADKMFAIQQAQIELESQGLETPENLAKQVTSRAQYAMQIIDIEQKKNKAIRDLDNAAVDDRTKANVRTRELEVQQLKRNRDEALKDVETRFERGGATPAERDAARRIRAEQEAEETKTLAQIKFDAGKKDLNAALELNQARVDAAENLRLKLKAIGEQETEDQRQARRVQSEESIRQRDEASRRRLQDTEFAFGQGLATPGQLRDARRRRLVDEKSFNDERMALQFEFQQKSIAAINEYSSARTQAEDNLQNALLEIDRGAAADDLKYVQEQHQRKLDKIDDDVRSGKISASQELQRQLTAEIQNQGRLEKLQLIEGSHLYDERNAKIAQSIAHIKDLSARITAMTAGAGSELLGTISGFLGGFRGSSRVGGALSGVSSVFRAQAGYIQSQAGPGGMQGMGSTNMIAGIGQSFKALAKGTGSFSDNLTHATEALGSMFQVVQGFIQATSTTSKTSAALGGGMAAGGMGQMIGSLFGKAGGPIGAVIGMGVGALVGFFSASARKKTEEAAKKLSDTFNHIAETLNEGSVGLREAITSMEATRKQTVTQLSGKKGGREQLNNLLPGMDQQIAQLKAQQRQLSLQLSKDVTMLSTPSATRDTVRNLQGIIDKYKEYAEAVDDAKKAQDFLRLSVKDFIEQQQRELTGAETEAIQNAIQYNDLLQQRLDIQKSVADQEYQILTAGALVRQMTPGMQKGKAIEDLRDSAKKQLDQLDRQLALAKTRVDAESAIFNLASDRITLENMLLDRQKEAVQLEVQKYSIIAAVMAAAKTATSPTQVQNMIDQLVRGMGLDRSAEAQYSQQARMGYGGYNGNL